MLSGPLTKMIAQVAEQVSYTLPLGASQLPLNPLIGQTLSLTFLDQINCIHCNRKITKSYQQGYCYVCFRTLAQCDLCILKPETCHYHLGTCREPAWGMSHCMQPHYVYLAESTHLKVGITRASQVPTRWLDQGARQALLLFKTLSRYHAGLIEACLAQYVSDKTNWRQLFRIGGPLLDLPAEAAQLLETAQSDLAALALQYPMMHESELTPILAPSQVFDYPILQYPDKIQTLSFDKQSEITGKLLGIKGQYLILESGVFNIRKHSGYHATVLWENHAVSLTAGH